MNNEELAINETHKPYGEMEMLEVVRYIGWVREKYSCIEYSVVGVAMMQTGSCAVILNTPERFMYIPTNRLLEDFESINGDVLGEVRQ